MSEAGILRLPSDTLNIILSEVLKDPQEWSRVQLVCKRFKELFDTKRKVSVKIDDREVQLIRHESKYYISLSNPEENFSTYKVPPVGTFL